MQVDFADLFQRFGPLVHRRARHILGNPADAEEATQDVFIKAMAAIAGLPEDTRLAVWLHRVTTNYCLNMLRNRQNRARLRDLRQAELRPTGEARDAERMAIMRQLLAEAEPAWAEAALLVFVEGMSHRDAGRALGVSPSTVGNLCGRFVAWGRQHLNPGPEGAP